MEKWVKIVLLIVGVSCAMTFLSLYLVQTYTDLWDKDKPITNHPYGIMLLVFGGIFVLTTAVSGCIFASEGEGGY